MHSYQCQRRAETAEVLLDKPAGVYLYWQPTQKDFSSPHQKAFIIQLAGWMPRALSRGPGLWISAHGGRDAGVTKPSIRQGD